MWRQFESRIKHDLLATGHVVTHIPSALIKTKGGTHRQKTDCDFSAAWRGEAIYFDAKACGEATFNLESLVFRESKVHQFNFLIDACNKNCKAGYLIWMYDKGLILWADVHVIATLRLNGVKSLDENTFLINSMKDDKPINLGDLLWGVR